MDFDEILREIAATAVLAAGAKVIEVLADAVRDA